MIVNVLNVFLFSLPIPPLCVYIYTTIDTHTNANTYASNYYGLTLASYTPNYDMLPVISVDSHIKIIQYYGYA